ncbi:MAG: hypothetical protein JXR60_08730 [Bacteroidales bacterium]|nr:hypothetical protein [Bacteroidales bacterium]
MIKITECPRDAMQGVEEFIPTSKKINYINLLLKVGFDYLDFGSFVSPKAIPQLKDTDQLVEAIDKTGTNTKLIAIVASENGADRALLYNAVDVLGYPFSFSETFLKKNINADLVKAVKLTDYFQNLCTKNGKVLRQYITMAFGNPYGDKWTEDMLYEWVDFFYRKGIRHITLSDITGEAKVETVANIYKNIIKDYSELELGLHLHAKSDTWLALIDAAYKSGCRSFDTVLNEAGGCPMTGKDLLNNMNAFNLLSYLKQQSIETKLDLSLLQEALRFSVGIF